MTTRLSKALIVVFVLGMTAGAASQASAIPVGWSCVGNCGTLGANGDITAPPGSTTYDYVVTTNAPSNSGLNLGFNEVNGSVLTSTSFSASGLEQLTFYFNYITSDGAGYPEYAWAQLVPDGGLPVLLFTARTCETTPCNTVPGVGMPPLGAGVTLVPSSTPVLANQTEWSPLAGWSGSCFNVGCGNTGWIQALYTPTAGSYRLQFGVVNVNDDQYDSGLAIASAQIGSTPISPPTVPDGGTTFSLLGLGLLGLGVARRRFLLKN